MPVLPGSKVTELCGTLRGDPGLPCGSVVKNSPIVLETQVQSLGQEDTLKNEMATHFSTLACKIPWIEKPGRLQFWGWQKS